MTDMANDVFNVDLLFRMIAHWLRTKPKSYLGSPYGAPLDDWLQKPLSSPIADAFLAKMKVDIPVLAALPPGTISLEATDDGIDQRNLFININGSSISVDSLVGEVDRGSY
jgi:hypothetical protein